MDPRWTWTNNPTLSLQSDAAAEPVISIHGDNLHHANIIYDNTACSGNHQISNTPFGSLNVNNIHGDNSDGGNITYDITPYGNIVYGDSPDVGNPCAHNINVSHGGSPGVYGYNTAPLAVGSPTHDVFLRRDRANASVASGVTGLINYPTLASNTNMSAIEPPILSADHDGQATGSVPDKNRYFCLHEGCFQDFGRPSDLERHWKKHLRPEFECPFAGCHRKGAQGFSRKDNMNKHLKNCKFQPRS